MRIFQIKNQVEGFASIDFEEIDMMSVLKTGDVSVLEGRCFKWDKTVNSAISDCPFFIGSLPIFLTSKLGSILNDSNVSRATFDVEGKSYTIVSALEQLDNVLDLERSKYRTFRSGKIMDVTSYVFQAKKTYPKLFTLQELKMYTFCNEEIAKSFLSCHFNQLSFVECLMM